MTETTTERTCANCGVNINHRHRLAKYCEDCRQVPKGKRKKVSSTEDKCAVILCPGPSLAKAPKEFSDFTVAVTDAIFWPVPLDVWCYQEGPQHTHQERYGVYSKELLDRVEAKESFELWGYKGTGHRWKRWEIEGLKVYDGMYVQEMVDEKLPWLDSRKHNYAKRKPTGPRNVFWHNPKRANWAARNKMNPGSEGPTFYAIVRLMYLGYTKIDLYGCDMEGRKNWRAGRLTEINQKLGFEIRWDREKKLMSALIAEASSHGIAIRRH